MKPKIEIGPKCPRCKCEDVTRERNFGKPIKDGRWWCMKCGHLWRVGGTEKTPSAADWARAEERAKRRQPSCSKCGDPTHRLPDCPERNRY